MAADKTAIEAATATLVPVTAYTFNLTGEIGRVVELVHHGNVDDPVYFSVKTIEGALPTLTVAGNEGAVILAGERLTVRVPKNGLWLRMISAGTARITVDGTEK